MTIREDETGARRWSRPHSWSVSAQVADRARQTVLDAAARRPALGDALLRGGLNALVPVLSQEIEAAAPTSDAADADPELAEACGLALADAALAAASKGAREIALRALEVGLIDAVADVLGVALRAGAETGGGSEADGARLRSEICDALGLRPGAGDAALAAAVRVAARQRDAAVAREAAWVQAAREVVGVDAGVDWEVPRSVLESWRGRSPALEAASRELAEARKQRDAARSLERAASRDKLEAEEALCFLAGELGVAVEDDEPAGALARRCAAAAAGRTAVTNTFAAAFGVPPGCAPEQLERAAAAIKNNLEAALEARGRHAPGADASRLAAELRRLLEAGGSAVSARAPFNVGSARKLVADMLAAITGRAPDGKFDPVTKLTELREAIAELRLRLQALQGGPADASALESVAALEALVPAGALAEEPAMREAGWISPDVAEATRQHLVEAALALAAHGVDAEYRAMGIRALAERVLDHARLRASGPGADAIRQLELELAVGRVAAALGVEAPDARPIRLAELAAARAEELRVALERRAGDEDDGARADEAASKLLAELGVLASSRVALTHADLEAGRGAARRARQALAEILVRVGGAAEHDALDELARAAAVAVARLPSPADVFELRELLLRGLEPAASEGDPAGALRWCAAEVAGVAAAVQTAAERLGVAADDGGPTSVGTLAERVRDAAAAAGSDEGVLAWAREAHAALLRLDEDLAEKAPARAQSASREEHADAGVSRDWSELLDDLREVLRARDWTQLDEHLREGEDLPRLTAELLCNVEVDDDAPRVPQAELLDVSFAERVLDRFDRGIALLPNATRSERADRLSSAIEDSLP